MLGAIVDSDVGTSDEEIVTDEDCEAVGVVDSEEEVSVELDSVSVDNVGEVVSVGFVGSVVVETEGTISVELVYVASEVVVERLDSVLLLMEGHGTSTEDESEVASVELYEGVETEVLWTELETEINEDVSRQVVV